MFSDNYITTQTETKNKKCMKNLLPIPTDEAEIRKYALHAVAAMDEEMEQKVMGRKLNEIPKIMSWYIKTYIRDFQCLALVAEKYGDPEVERLHSEFRALPFFDKMRCMEVRVFRIPGQPIRSPSNFLLIESSGIFDSALGLGGSEQRNEWLDALVKCGFGESVLACAYNRGTIWNIARTGHLDVILLDDNDGFSSKVNYVCNLQDELVKMGLKKPLFFSHGPYSHTIGSPAPYLRRFADEQWPPRQ